MTQEKILEYNKRCALFLGAIDSTHSWGYLLHPDQLNLSFDLFDEKLFSNDGGSGWFIKDLKFHTDWNWIMVVVEAIEKLDRGDEHGRFRLMRYGSSCNWNNLPPSINGDSPKEAVVESINQFLIWLQKDK